MTDRYKDYGEKYQHAAELLANLTNQPVVSPLVYKTLNAIIALVKAETAIALLGD